MLWWWINETLWKQCFLFRYQNIKTANAVLSPARNLGKNFREIRIKNCFWKRRSVRKVTAFLSKRLCFEMGPKMWQWVESMKLNKANIYMIAIFFHATDSDICDANCRWPGTKQTIKSPHSDAILSTAISTILHALNKLHLRRCGKSTSRWIHCYGIVNLITVTMFRAMYRNWNRILLFVNHTKLSFKQCCSK